MRPGLFQVIFFPFLETLPFAKVQFFFSSTAAVCDEKFFFPWTPHPSKNWNLLCCFSPWAPSPLIPVLRRIECDSILMGTCFFLLGSDCFSLPSRHLFLPFLCPFLSEPLFFCQNHLLFGFCGYSPTRPRVMDFSARLLFVNMAAFLFIFKECLFSSNITPLPSPLLWLPFALLCLKFPFQISWGLLLYGLLWFLSPFLGSVLSAWFFPPWPFFFPGVPQSLGGFLVLPRNFFFWSWGGRWFFSKAPRRVSSSPSKPPLSIWSPSGPMLLPAFFFLLLHF